MKISHSNVGVVVVVMAIMLTVGVYADQTWNNGGGDYSWFNTNNWSGRALPGNGDVATISNNCSDASPVVVATTTGVAKQVRLGYNAGEAGYLWVQSGGITNNANNTHYVGNAGFGKFRVSGGIFKPLGSVDFGGAAGGQGVGLIDGGSVYSSWNTIIGDAGSGTVTMTSGSVSVGSGQYLYLGNTNTGVGTLVLSNGVVTMPSTAWMYVGNRGRGTFDVEGGSAYAGYFYIGEYAGATGTATIGGGVFTGANAFVVGDAGVGSLTQTGGTGVLSNTGMTLGNAAGGNGTYTFQDGVLSHPNTKDMIVGNAGVGRLILSSTNGITPKSLTVGATGSGCVTQWAGSITCSGNNIVLGSSSGSYGEYWLTNGTVTVGGTVQLQVGASGTGRFTQVGGTVSTPRDVDLGMNAGGIGTYVLAGGAFNPGWSLVVGASGTGNVTQTGGTLALAGGGVYSLTVGQNAGGSGNYTLSNGTIAIGGVCQLQVGASGTGLFTQVNGIMGVAREVYLGKNAGGNGTYLLQGGTFTAGTSSAGAFIGDAGQGYFRQERDLAFNSGFTIGNSTGGIGVLESVAGTVTVSSAASITVGKQGTGTWYLHGNTVYCPNDNGGVLTIRATTNALGTLRGWGTFNFAVNPRLANNGLVIADGYGTNHDLDLTMFNGAPLWSNAVENVTSNGWYAVNHGQLLLASVPAISNNVSAWWGENKASDTDGTLDLVNSVAATFTGIPNSAGATNLTISLLAPDRTDVPAPNGAAAGRTFIGVWNLALTKSFTSAELQFRYDNYAAGSQLVRLCRYDTGSSTWVQVPTTALSGYRLDATGLTNLGLYAIAASGNRGTCMLIR